MIQLLKTHSAKLKRAAQCLDIIATRMELIKEGSVTVERQKKIMEKDNREKADEFLRLMDEINEVDYKLKTPVSVVMCREENSVIIAESFYENVG